jgi:hypothetical protein
MFPGTFLLPFGIFLAGWSAQRGWHWVVTDIVSDNWFEACMPRIVMRCSTLFRLQGHCMRGCWTDPRIPIDADIRSRYVHFACSVWYVSLTSIHSYRKFNAYISYSPRCCFVLPLSRRLRLPPVRASDVREAGVRKRRHHPRMSSHRPRVSCVRPLTYRSDYTPWDIDILLQHLYSPLLLWKYGQRIRASSRYAQKGQMRTPPSAPGASAPPPAQAVGEKKKAPETK